MASVLNPHLQPYTAKPWGYAGSPGHPFEAEWWRVAEATAWTGWKQSEHRQALCVDARGRALKHGVDQFMETVEQSIAA